MRLSVCHLNFINHECIAPDMKPYKDKLIAYKRVVVRLFWQGFARKYGIAGMLTTASLREIHQNLVAIYNFA